MKGVLASSPARWTTPAPSVPGFHERAYLYVSLLGARNHSRTLPAMGEHNKNWSTQNFIYLLSCKALSQLRCAVRATPRFDDDVKFAASWCCGRSPRRTRVCRGKKFAAVVRRGHQRRGHRAAGDQDGGGRGLGAFLPARAQAVPVAPCIKVVSVVRRRPRHPRRCAWRSSRRCATGAWASRTTSGGRALPVCNER